MQVSTVRDVLAVVCRKCGVSIRCLRLFHRVISLHRATTLRIAQGQPIRRQGQTITREGSRQTRQTPAKKFTWNYHDM